MPRLESRTVWLALACVLCACAQESQVAPAVRNVVLVSVDTLRADHLGAYGHPLPTSPNLDALAAEGVLFEDASSTAPWTLPAHVSLLTGLFPRGHGVRTNRNRLRDDVPTLAALLAERGFETAAFVNAFFMESRFGLDRGFAHYEMFPEDQSREGATGKIVGAAQKWLDAQGDSRFFLLLHLFDTHSDYRSLPRHEKLLVQGTSRYDGNTIQIMMGMRGDVPLEPPDAEHLAQLYDAGIRQLDEQLAGLFSDLRRRGRFDDTLVVVTSDHGEEFLDHGGMVHGHTHYQELLRIPLILTGPAVPKGLRVATPVSITDLMPTLLELTGVETPQGLDGRSLLPLLRGGEADGDGRMLLAETGPMEEDALRSLRRGRFKLIHDTRSDRHELYDLETDPRERTDLSDTRPELRRELTAALDEMLRDRRTSPTLPPLTDEMKARLRSMGYLEP